MLEGLGADGLGDRCGSTVAAHRSERPTDHTSGPRAIERELTEHPGPTQSEVRTRDRSSEIRSRR